MRMLLDLILPPRCAGCEREGAVLCDPCTAPLRRRLDEPPGVPLGMPASLPAGVVQLEWCAMYSGPVRASLHALKYKGERRLVAPLAAALAERWTRVAAGGDLMTWVPVHRSRLQERGFDQAEELATAAARRLGLPATRLLERSQRTAAQHALGQEARRGNTSAAFAVRAGRTGQLHDRWIVVVDDIVTSGATLAGCATALLEAGALAVSALCVARDR
jgi:ComF family protein